mmetsp:Transcript_67706/g.195702  ORF Transcript_67706/g.195702 Transcript_67706/m.195702 type:complete len:390 (+) Transcript_67706:61-1230(+)
MMAATSQLRLAAVVSLALLRCGDAVRHSVPKSMGDDLPSSVDAASDLLQELDENRDGKLGKSELQYAFRGVDDPHVLDTLERRVASADSDGDAYLDVVEVEEFIGVFPASALLRATSFPNQSERDATEEADDIAADAIADLFRLLDADADGKIEKGDLLALVLRDTADRPDLVALLKQLFDEADESGDGKLARRGVETFLQLLRDHLPGVEMPNGRELDGAQLRDRDGDGDAAADLFAELDENGDGHVDFEEVLRVATSDDMEVAGMLRHRFAEADLNADGLLDTLEVEEFVGRFPASALRRTTTLAEPDAAEEEDDAAESLAHLFRALDTNADGKIEKEDMLSFVLQQGFGESAESLEGLFVEAGEDGDLKLDSREAESFLRILGDHA